MAWFKVDDTLHSHPKVRRAGAAAVGVWAAAGSYCMAYKTDGKVPAWWLDSWGKTGLTAARKLVEVELWVETSDGYRFHDWQDYQPSSDEIERDREAARVRMKVLRERRRQSRKGGSDDDPES